MNRSEKQTITSRRTTRKRRVGRKPSWDIPDFLLRNEQRLSPQPQNVILEKFINDDEGVCHHCRKKKNRKNLVPCKNKDGKLSFCVACLKKYDSKMCPVGRDHCEGRVCQRAFIEEDLSKMDYLVKNLSNPNSSDSEEKRIAFADKKKIIQQNNWAIRSCNYNSNKNNQDREKTVDEKFKLGYLEQEFADYNNLPTMDFEFNKCPSNKIDMKNLKVYAVYNEDSTEEFDNDLIPFAIKLPLCPTIRPNIDNQYILGESQTPNPRPGKKFMKTIIPTDEGTSLSNTSGLKSQTPERSHGGLFMIKR